DLNFGMHNRFATLGWAIGSRSCSVPLVDRAWVKFRPPVHMASWPWQRDAPMHGFTTVANWRSYGPAWSDGIRLGLKAHSFRKLSDLPSLTPSVGIALNIDPGD